MNKRFGFDCDVLSEDGVKMVLSGSEIALYAYIDALGGIIWRVNHDISHGRLAITDKIQSELLELQYCIEFAVYNSRRFGVEIPEPKENEHVQRTESYNKWFRWWDNYIKNTLTSVEFSKLGELLKNEKDVSHYRPNEDWR